jgi:hypothetical protein
MANKSWRNYRPKGVIFPWVQRPVPYSELSSDIYINQLSIPREPSVLAYNRGSALGEWTTSSANGSCDCSVTSDRYKFTNAKGKFTDVWGHVFRRANVENRTVFALMACLMNQSFCSSHSDCFITHNK